MLLTSALRDATADFLLHGYRFTGRLRASSDDPKADRRVPVRMLGDGALVVRGARGVELFYDDDAIKRDGAMPETVSGGLFGEGSVHGLDDQQHRIRKAMFIRAAMDQDAVARLLEDSHGEWQRHIDEVWGRGHSGSVYDAAVGVYGRSILRWAGIDTSRRTATRIAQHEAEIVDGFAVVGPAYLLGKWRRHTCDEWFTARVRRARAGEISPPAGSAFDLVLQHVDADGEPLSDHLAGVELQNVIRPTIAVARFAAFLALAMHEHPQWRERIFDEARERDGTRGGPLATAFGEEVRRYYPFVPLLPGVARRGLVFDGAPVTEGERVLLDIYGTNHDERHWPSPHTFDPRRFLGTGEERSAHFVPQGGGHAETGHRCPGEIITVGLLAQTASELSQLDAFLAGGQRLSFRMSRMPTMPASGVVFTRASRRGPSRTAGHSGRAVSQTP